MPFYLAILKHFHCTFLASLFGYFSITLAGNKGNKLMLNKQGQEFLSSFYFNSLPLPVSPALLFPSFAFLISSSSAYILLPLPSSLPSPFACSSSAFRIYSAKFATLPPRCSCSCHSGHCSLICSNTFLISCPLGRK